MRNKISKENLILLLNKHNIQCNVGSCPEIYLEKAFKKQYKHQRLKNAKILGETSVALFLNHRFTNKQELHYTSTLKKVLKMF